MPELNELNPFFKQPTLDDFRNPQQYNSAAGSDEQETPPEYNLDDTAPSEIEGTNYHLIEGLYDNVIDNINQLLGSYGRDITVRISNVYLGNNYGNKPTDPKPMFKNAQWRLIDENDVVVATNGIQEFDEEPDSDIWTFRLNEVAYGGESPHPVRILRIKAIINYDVTSGGIVDEEDSIVEQNLKLVMMM